MVNPVSHTICKNCRSYHTTFGELGLRTNRYDSTVFQPRLRQAASSRLARKYLYNLLFLQLLHIPLLSWIPVEAESHLVHLPSAQDGRHSNGRPGHEITPRPSSSRMQIRAHRLLQHSTSRILTIIRAPHPQPPNSHRVQ